MFGNIVIFYTISILLEITIGFTMQYYITILHWIISYLKLEIIIKLHIKSFIIGKILRLDTL